MLSGGASTKVRNASVPTGTRRLSPAPRRAPGRPGPPPAQTPQRARGSAPGGDARSRPAHRPYRRSRVRGRIHPDLRTASQADPRFRSVRLHVGVVTSALDHHREQVRGRPQLDASDSVLPQLFAQPPGALAIGPGPRAPQGVQEPAHRSLLVRPSVSGRRASDPGGALAVPRVLHQGTGVQQYSQGTIERTP